MKEAILVPMVSVGGILLNSDISDYPNNHFEYSVEAGAFGYHSYSFSDVPVIAYVDVKGKIESIHCSKECIWQGVNLIGLDYKNFTEIFSITPNDSDLSYDMTGEDDHPQIVYDFDELGLLIWVFNGKIVTVSAAIYEDEL